MNAGGRMAQSLVARLVAYFLLPALAISGLVAWLAHQRVRDALRESIFERLEVVAATKEAAFGDWVEHLSSDVSLLATLGEVSARAAVLNDETIPEASRRVARQRLTELLLRMVEKRPSLAEIFVLTPVGGRVAVSSEPRHVGEYRTRDRYFTDGRNGLFVQNIYPSPISLKPTLTIAAPIPGAAGANVGVLVAHLSLEYLDRNILQKTGLGRSGLVTLVDRHRVLVTGQRYGSGLTGSATRSLAVDEVVQKLDGRALYSDLEGRPVIGVYRWLEDHEIGLVVEISQQEAFAPARRLAASILALGLPAIALFVAGVVLAARRIASPIREMAGLAEKVSGGDLSTRVPVRTRDEIGVLARTFNEMVGELAKLYAEMRAKIDELELAKMEKERLIAELEEKNAELERFTYTVSHDLKAPLVTIRGFLGYAERALEAGDAERGRRDLEFISDAAGRMGRLLEELLELSRLGRVIHPPEEVDLVDLCREVASSLAADGVAMHVASDLPVVRGDRLRLRQVFENLLTNALKFTGEQAPPRVEIGVRGGSRESAEGEAVLYVRDNGVGVDPRYQERIFGLFERLQTNVEGTGIGLALVRRIVELHGGRIWVESDGEGCGSTFCFTLPGDPAAPVSR